MSDFSWMERAMENGEERIKKMFAEYERLAQEQTILDLEIGDTVLFAAGLINCGHYWIRVEATVVDLGQNSVKVLWDSPGIGIREEWIDRVLITDKIKGVEK